MITDKETNTVYLSEKLYSDKRYTKTCNTLTELLKKHSIKYRFLKATKDIWARDYMPIQINKKEFIEYRYDPDYLQKSEKGYRNLKTYPDMVCDTIGLKTKKSDLILDGGNIVKSSNCIILTDKVIKENQHSYSKNELIKKLQETFQVNKVVLIPWDKKCKYGHSDGMLRFIDDDTVLISHYYKKDSVLLYRLNLNGIKTKFVNFKVKKSDKRNWAYINFLQTKNIILLPKFKIEEDIQALKQISEYYPEYSKNNRIKQIDMTEIVKDGGALNCITWTTKE